MRKKNGFQLPKGMKDLLPGEARVKRNLEDLLVEKYSRWGYQEVMTPILEYYENLQPAETPEDQFFKLIDRQGQILALRTDMTTPIARMVASRMNGSRLPLRLFYAGNVFRYESPQMGRQREFCQAGVELIGDGKPSADAEIIALAVECLQEAGLEGFQISIGQIKFIKGIFEGIEVDEFTRENLLRALARKDFVELEILLERYQVNPETKNTILSLPSLRGDSSIIEEAGTLLVNETALQALDNLQEVFHYLKAYGVDREVFVDFGIMRDFEYYSGIVFEGYCPGVGAPICGGGRYDQLLGHYGLNCPATGFAIGLERLMLALEGKKVIYDICDLDYLVVGKDFDQVISQAQELRRQGFRVQVAARAEDFSGHAKNMIVI